MPVAFQEPFDCNLPPPTQYLPYSTQAHTMPFKTIWVPLGDSTFWEAVHKGLTSHQLVIGILSWLPK